MPNIVETIREMPVRQKVTMLVVLAVSVAALVLVFAWSQKLDYRLLYSNMADSDAGAVVQKLKEMKVPYRVEGGGILVPEDKVYDLRLQLASQGLPHGGGVGFEVFDKTDFGTTDFVQRLNYRRAMQGELARTIMALSEVEQCRVHLATPEKSLFVQEEAKPSASVLVKLRQGRTLSQGQVQGIVHMVSSSIEGLNPRDVTIIDSRGEMLTRPAEESSLSSSQLEYRRNYERDIESRVVGILEPVVGKSKVRAKVTAALDFTKVEKTEEKYDPDGQVARSEQRSNEKSSSGTSGGVAGVSSNTPAKAVTKAAGGQGQSQKQNETVNYEISRVTSHVVNASGEVKRLSVAVIVDGTYAGQAGAKERKYAPRSEEDIRRYEDLVRKAVGFTADRGDEVRVVNMQFEGAPQEEFGEQPRQIMPIIAAVAKYAVPIVAVVLFFLFVVKPVMKTISVPGAGKRSQAALPEALAELEKAISSQDRKALTGHDQVIEWAKKNPDQAANLIKGWIGE